MTIALFGSIMVFVELGRRWALAQVKRHGPESRTGVGLVDGSVYGLLALLVGFTFSGAAARFDTRRELVAKEANAVSTAWQRIDLLPVEFQEPIREGMRRYLDAVIESYAQMIETRDPFAEPPAVTGAQDQLWHEVMAVCTTASCDRARMLFVPAVNEVFDTVDEERYARYIHPPAIIFVMLGISALASSLFIGYGLASVPERNWLYIVGFALSVSIATYVIIDLEYPRHGLIRVDGMDRVLVDERAAMQPSGPQH